MLSSMCRSIACASTATAIESTGSWALAAAQVCWLMSLTETSTSALSSAAIQAASVSQKGSSARPIRRLSSAVNLVGWEKSSVRIRSPDASSACSRSAASLRSLTLIAVIDARRLARRAPRWVTHRPPHRGP